MAGNVVLCIMKVRAPKGYVASVFWDTGATSNFVRKAFAKHCGFQGHQETTLRVGGASEGHQRTLFWVKTEYRLKGQTIYLFSQKHL